MDRGFQFETASEVSLSLIAARAQGRERAAMGPGMAFARSQSKNNNVAFIVSARAARCCGNGVQEWRW
jgi:hypothetical protein